jgi:hypothetical protein
MWGLFYRHWQITFISFATLSDRLNESAGFPPKAEKINGGVRRKVPHSSSLS